ncbi:MAG: hypothetical protein MJ072_01495, partial [Clostridia bacterium]|nr:hypothetical protein [Clostridia bacterium]
RADGLVLFNDWGTCTRLGAATTCEEISDVKMTNIDVIHATASVLDVLHCDYADIHDVVYDGIRIEFDDYMRDCVYQYSDDQRYADHVLSKEYVPDVFSGTILHHFEYSNVKDNPEGIVGKLHDVEIKNVDIYGEQAVQFAFKGFDEEHKVHGVRISNVYKNGKKVTADDVVYRETEFSEDISFE